ncbi:MAG TPA: A24 family peptidase [Candidatus Binatia bacterium]|nr:A24 family peptidase [Candidatus Binatia bacterium]
MVLLEGLRASPGFLLLAVTLLGLCVGSFLNVVIHRLPRRLERDWRVECRTLLALPEQPEPAVSLMRPGSRCPACGGAIRPWHNVPVLGWLWLRGRCADCRAPISAQYPLVEAGTALASAACAWHFGWGAPLGAALLLTWFLVALAVIDLHTQLLPDVLTLPLLWLGLLLSLGGMFTGPAASIAGAAAGYGVLWCIFQAYRLATGREGMGFGDFKLLAALGAWFGWQALVPIVLMASLAGAAVGIGLMAFRGRDRVTAIPFGPFLAAGGWIVLVGGGALLPGLLPLR